ncbi:MAG: hypothetical protein AAGB12_15125 [Pseudomonadota bacterium]
MQILKEKKVARIIALFFGSVLTLTVGGPLKASDNNVWKLYAEIESINLSEPVNIKANFNQWETSDYTTGNKIYTKQSAFSGISWKQTTLGFNSRYHYYINFSSDTALWYYLEQNDEERLTALKEPLNIDLQANQMRANGVFVAHKIQWQNLQLGARLTYLNLNELTYGKAFGQYDAREDLDTQTRLTIDYAYTEESILDRLVEEPSGKGWILDLELAWEYDSHQLHITIDEAFNRLAWKTAPASLIEGNLADLNIRRDAALQFQEFYVNIQQELPMHSKASYQYQVNHWLSAGVNWEKIDQQSWERLFATTQIMDDSFATLTWGAADDTLGISLDFPYFYFAIETETFEFEESHVLNLSLGVQARF